MNESVNFKVGDTVKFNLNNLFIHKGFVKDVLTLEKAIESPWFSALSFDNEKYYTTFSRKIIPRRFSDDDLITCRILLLERDYG